MVSSFEDVCNMLSDILTSLPKRVQDSFGVSEPSFVKIPATLDMDQHTQRVKEFKKSIPDKKPETLASFQLAQLARKIPDTTRELAAKALRSINDGKYGSQLLSRSDLLYLVRVWAYYLRRINGAREFGDYFNRLQSFLSTNPLNNLGNYRCLLLHFRADGDNFEISDGIGIRRLYPWEYPEIIPEIAKAGFPFRRPALETLADANFILEAKSNSLGGGNDWEKFDQFKRIIDIVSVSSNGNVWSSQVFILGSNSMTQYEGVRGKDFGDLIGVVPNDQTNRFVNRLRKGWETRTNTVLKSVFRALRQEEDSEIEFHVVKLVSSLEKLMGSPGAGCGMRLAWLLEKNPDQREKANEEFTIIKELRDRIIHDVLLYDLMTLQEKSYTLDSIHKLSGWLFESISDFLDSEHSFKDWQKDLGRKLFGK